MADKSSTLNQTTIPTGTSPNSRPAKRLGIRWLWPVAHGHMTWLSRERTLVGRGDDCDAQLGGPEISRHHAEILRDGPIYIVRDLGSTNGVFLNGTRVAESVLADRDLLRMGEWIGTVVERLHGEDDAVDACRCEHGLVSGPALAPVLDVAKRSAALNLPLVIQGETGTGKELVARAIHAWSGRAGRFVAVNCAALPESLAEAELFGHRKGAFTGADRASPGYFRTAQEGTLFLDEISDLPPSLQPKLLRALERHEVVPVGESLPIRVDVRLLAATQVPLSDQVALGRFRADLKARLEGVVVALPPLRNRIEEVPYLFDWLMRRHSGEQSPEIEARLIEQLCLYAWPQNVRELELLARRLVGLYADEQRLRRSHLPEQMLTQRGRSASPSVAYESPDGYGARDLRDLDSFSRALRVQRGNVSRAAAQAGISRQRAYRLLEAHPEVDAKSFRRTSRQRIPSGPQDCPGDS